VFVYGSDFCILHCKNDHGKTDKCKKIKIVERIQEKKFWNLFIPSADYIFDNHSAERQGAADSTGYD
jgi:hypothetical protein